VTSCLHKSLPGAGNNVTLTASNITDGNPNSSITQVTFYLVSNNDGMLEPGTDTLLGYATRTAGAADVSIGPAPPGSRWRDAATGRKFSARWTWLFLSC